MSKSKLEKTTNVRQQLVAAKRGKSIINFVRPFESDSFTGFVMDVGAQFFLLAVLGNGFEFENFTCLRIKDIRRLQVPAKHEPLYKAVRRMRGDKMPPRPKVNLVDASSILRTLHPSVVTVHREMTDPESCVIGRTTFDNKVFFEFLEVDPDGKWDSEPSYYRLNQVTRIDLPGPYEKALLLVAGEPKLEPRKPA